jgi:glycosyltransferase involved in cell wall biosynthesis
MAPAVSVIIPNYNYGDFIGETLRSVLAQTFQDFEVIVIDDGSTDKSREIIRGAEADFNGKLMLIEQKNEGVYSARNKGIRIARGKYIAFLDADDIWNRTALESLKLYLDGHPDVALAYANTQYFDSKTGKVLGTNFGEKAKRPREGQCSDELFLRGNFIPLMASIVRREIFDAIGFFDPKLKVGGDYELWMRLTDRYSAGYVDEVLCKVRRHPGNLTFKTLPQARAQIRIMKNVLRQCPGMIMKVGPAAVRQKWYRISCNLGAAYLKEGRKMRARRWFIKAWRHDPNIFASKLVIYYFLSYILNGFFLKNISNISIFLKKRKVA